MKLPVGTLVLTVGTVMLVSCAQVAPPLPTASIPPSSPLPAFTPAPPDTPTPPPPPTPTLIPPTQSEEGLPIQLPTGDPQAEWNGISIMPGAINGEEIRANAYAFTIHSSADDILAYYLVEPLDLGWQLFGYGPGESGELAILFTGENGTLQVSISIIDEQNSLFYVMLSQQ